MGEFFQPQTTELPGMKPSPWTGSNYFSNLMSGQNVPQVSMPNAPATTTALQQMQNSINQYGPQMGEFYSRLLRGGGKQDLTTLMGERAKVYQNDMDQLKAQAGLLPRGSGQSRYLGNALGGLTNQYNMQNQQLMLDQYNNALGNQFAAAQGLGAMPQYYAQPSGLELQLLGLQQPYDLANQQAQMQGQGVQAQLLSQLLQGTPIDYMVTPSQAQQLFGWLGPVLGGLGQAAGAGLPTAV